MNLEGTWHTELGSTLVIERVRDGGLSGTHATALSATGSAKGSIEVVGRTDADSGGEAVAFSVCWRNDLSDWHSATAWVGQAQRIDGLDRISAMWLLTVETSPERDWYATPATEVTNVPSSVAPATV
jgi:avidin family protein